MKIEHKITVKGGLYYVTGWVDKNGMPHTPESNPGFPTREQALAWAEKRASALVDQAALEPVDAELVEAVEEEPVSDPSPSDLLPNNDVVVEIPTGSANAEGQAPEIQVDAT